MINPNQKIDIIGAGIGGLTLAIALKKKGFAINVFEQANELKAVGAGIVLANNAMQVYEKLGMRNVLEQHGNVVKEFYLATPDLKPMAGASLQQFEDKYGVKNIAIHRGTLQKELEKHLTSEQLHTGYLLEQITRGEDDYQLQFANNKTVHSTLIIGADGIHSKARQAIFPESEIRNTNQICWRGVAEYQLPDAYQHQLIEAWGKGERFGFVKIASNTVYWFAVKSFKPGKAELGSEQLTDYFNYFNPMVNEIIEATPVNQIHAAPLTDLKPMKEWHKGGICLIGDAAHAMTPNMGQGAGQSIEDAHILSQCLGLFNPHEAFERYQDLRLKKVTQIINRSWQIGKIAHLSNPVAVFLRNQLLKLTPDSVNTKQTEMIFELAKVR